MKAGLEIFISLILVTMMAVLCVSFIVADVNSNDARDAYYAYYTQIENSDCAQSTINACIADANDAGYDLKVEKVGDVNNALYRLNFKYKYEISMLGVDKTHEIVGYIPE